MSRQGNNLRGVRPPTRAEYRFGFVLILLIATFAFLMLGSTWTWTHLVGVALTGATLVASLHAADASIRLQRLAALGASLAFIAALLVIALGNSGDATAALLDAALVVFAPVVIARSEIRRRVIDAQTVLAALCVYVLVGLLWAFIYSAIGTLGSGAFFAQRVDPTSADYIYFSFVTQLTVGYGDLTAAHGLGRACAVLQALFGQIYLVTVVGLLVARVTPRPGRDASSTDG